MAKLSIQAGSTSQSINLFIQDSSSTTGAGLTGLAFNTASLVAYYALPKATATAITLATLAAITTAWSSGGFKEVDSTNMPGWYRLDIPNAALAAASGRFVSIHLKGATNMAPCPLEIELTGWDNQDAVRGGMTALPNAAAAASGGLLVLGTNATAISFTAGMTISNATGDALALSSSGSNGDGLSAAGNGTGAGINLTAGATGNGILIAGGATSGSAIKASGTAGNAIALELVGQGSASGLSSTGGATGHGLTLVGGGTSGHGLNVTTTSGDGFHIAPTAGHGILATANGTSKHGIVATGGTAGTSDGVDCIAGTGGVDLRANQTGNITGNLSGSAGSVTAAVTISAGTGAGQLDFTSGVVKANTVQILGGACPAVSVTGVPKVDIQDIAGAAVSTSTAQLGVNAVNIGGTAAASATIGTVTTATTATNLTNAPTSGDLTATMKTSVENSVWDAARASHLATGVFGQIGQTILRDNTATAGAAGTITLDAGASTTVDIYKGDVLYIYSGTGVGQSRGISAYSAGRVATVVPNWVTTPDNTSKFILTTSRTPLVGTDTRVLTSADVSTSGETVAAVTGAVGSVSGAVASVTARVTANTDQWAGTTIPAPAVTGVPKVDVVDIAGAAVSTSSAQLGVNAVQIGAAVPGSATIGTVTTTTTATNLTNAPTSGDFTATMKTSLNAATPASVTGAVGSVTGNVGGNVVGTVASVVGSTGNPGANPTGSVSTSGSNTASTFLTNRTETVDDYWKDSLLLFTSGALVGQVKKVSAYTGSTKFVTVAGAFTAAPSNGDAFQLVNR